MNKIKDLAPFKMQILTGAIISVVTAAIIIIKQCCFHEIVLTENQRLYLFSTEAQVMGTLFGLLLTAFIFFNGRFNVKEQKDDAIGDAVRELTKKYYHNMIGISVISGIAISVCILGITIFNAMSHKACTIIVTASIIIICIDLILIFFFAVSLIDPNKEIREMERIYAKAREQMKPKGEESKGSLEDYLQSFKIIENTMSDWAKYCISKNPKSTTDFIRKQDNLPLFQSMRVLHQNEIFVSDLWKELDTIRRNRNAIMHSYDTPIEVSRTQCERIETIAKILSKEYSEFKNKCEADSDCNIMYLAWQTKENIHSELYK